VLTAVCGVGQKHRRAETVAAYLPRRISAPYRLRVAAKKRCATGDEKKPAATRDET